MAAARRIPSAPASAQPVFPDEIMEEIFLRLDAEADLARASAACSSFLRVVSARRFLRRFWSLHPPPVLGLLDGNLADRFVPSEPPYSFASEARALARAADFTFSFLPNARCWFPRDCCDGRVLLSLRGADLVVCDPLHRRYVMIPPIPDDLAPIPRAARRKHFEPFLAPATENEDGKLKDGDDLSFRVICAVECENKFRTLFFSSTNQKWELTTADQSSILFECRRSYAHGCFFWVVPSERNAAMLDTREMKFSVIDLPSNYDTLNSAAIVEVGKDRIGLLTLHDRTIDLSCKIWRNNGVRIEEWQHYKMIPLPKDSDGFYYSWCIMGAAERYVSLLRSDANGFPVRTECFVLDLKTMLLEKLCMLNHMAANANIYASFPLPLAPPSL
ncbi:unnamed protein product [Urochloa humidicola]